MCVKKNTTDLEVAKGSKGDNSVQFGPSERQKLIL